MEGGRVNDIHQERPSNLRFPEDLKRQRDELMRAQFAADVKALEKARDSINDEKCHAAMIKSYLACGYYDGSLSFDACRSEVDQSVSVVASQWFKQRNPSYVINLSVDPIAMSVISSRYMDPNPGPVHRRK